MNPPSFPRLLVLLAGLPLVAGAADWQSLTSNSPFGSAPAPTAAATGDLEFRGVVQEEGVYLVNLYNPTTKTAQWIPVNGKVAGLEVKSYDEANGGKVSITQGGRTLNLPMKQARVALVAAAPLPPPGGPGANGENGNGNGNDNDRRAQVRDMIRSRLENGPNGEPSPFVRSLPPEAQAMIEEFRRRRAEGGGGNGNQGGGGVQLQQAVSIQGQAQPAQQMQQSQGQRRRERGERP